MRIILFFFLFFSLYSCKNNTNATDSERMVQAIKAGSNADLIRNPVSALQPNDTINVAKMQFETTEYIFGKVKEGTLVRHSFKFKNTGKAPLLISDARSTCGCTVPTYPKQPVAAGESAEIEVQFNTAGKHDEQLKAVMIEANTFPNTNTLKLKGIIIN